MATTVRIPIDLRSPAVTANAGNSFWTVLGLTAHDFGHWEFLKDVSGQIYGLISVPTNLAVTPAAKIILSLAANATTGVTRMSVSSGAIAKTAESLNPATLTAIAAVDITVPATAYHTKEQSYTLAAAPVADDVLLVEIDHEGAHTNDTLAVNTLLTTAYLEIDVV